MVISSLFIKILLKFRNNDHLRIVDLISYLQYITYSKLASKLLDTGLYTSIFIICLYKFRSNQQLNIVS